MKKSTLLFAILFVAVLNFSWAQNTWTQKADFGGADRWSAVGFSIASKGYIGTGHYNLKDFWEYDATTNAWGQKADFGGTARGEAVGFSIGSKGYIGTGFDSTVGATNDFWEYDPSDNSWMQKADFGGGTRNGAVGFSIGNKGYIGTGSDGIHRKKDFWEYDPATDVWTKEADFGGTARIYAVGFSIGSKGYIGTGENNGGYFGDFWEYDPANNTWTQKADFGGTARSEGVAFSLGSKGYIGTGVDDNTGRNDFWEYDPANNTWTQIADFSGTVRYGAVGFSISGKGYVGTGYDDFSPKNEFWEYTPSTSLCFTPSNLSVTNITSSSAKLKWDAIAGVEGYKIRYQVSGINGWNYQFGLGSSKIITGLSANTGYVWEIRSICNISPHTTSDWSAKQSFTTASVRMDDESLQQVSFQIYPNPASDQATIQFTLPQSSHANLKVYDVSGEEIETLLDDNMRQGEHSLQLISYYFPKGVYLVKMISDLGIENQKLIVQ